MQTNNSHDALPIPRANHPTHRNSDKSKPYRIQLIGDAINSDFGKTVVLYDMAHGFKKPLFCFFQFHFYIMSLTGDKIIKIIGDNQMQGCITAIFRM